MNSLDEAKRECIKLEKLKYDGVAGTLPSWVPEPIKRDFKIIRENLFVEAPASYGKAKILKSYQEYEDMLDGKGGTFIPAIYHDKFDTLTKIREMVRLGPEKGLAYWVGEKINKDIQRGKITLLSAKMAHVKTHGTKKDRQKRYIKYQAKMDELYHQNKKLSFTELSNRTARYFRVSPRTIRNHTKNPHK